MDYEEKKRRQQVRVIIAEVGMVLSVILIVVVTLMAAMGFFIANDGKLEQAGLLQIHSLPTGATVELDGATLFSRTNLSRTMAAGEHHLVLSREGYDSWQKTIQMYSGVLVRLYYPRLFLQDRIPELALTLTLPQHQDQPGELAFYEVSPSRGYVLYSEKTSPVWTLIDVRNENLRETKVDLSSILPGVSLDTKLDDGLQQTSIMATVAMAPTFSFNGSIDEIRWSNNDEWVMAKVSYQDRREWILINLRSTKDSLNLTQTFGMSFDDIRILDNSASRLYALENHNLRQINVSNRSISQVLLSNIEAFSHNSNNIIYVTYNDKEPKQRQIGVYRDGDKAGTIIEEVSGSAKVQIALARYFDEDYICYTVDKTPRILYGSLPVYNADRANLSELKELEIGQDYSDMPQTLSLSRGNEYLVARNGQKYMTIDLERGDLYEYDAGTSAANWLDDSMLYAVIDGEIVVWDFDGTNRRNLSTSVAQSGETLDALNRPVFISSDNRWLYYLVRQYDDTVQLMRERIRD